MAESGALAKVMNCLCIIELSLNCLHMAHSMWCHGFCQSDKRNSDQSHASPCVCQKYKHACCQEVIPPEASGLLSCKRLVAVQEFWFLYEHKGHIVA